ncbi:MAG: hypothetical protein R3C05_15935 [Pirellulaceae bacterium]
MAQHAAAPPPAETTGDKAMDPYGGIRFCLNTSTVRGQELTITQQVDLAASSGYDAIEPWMSDLVKYKESGGSLPDLRKRIEDAKSPLKVRSASPTGLSMMTRRRARGLQQARGDMELLKSIGGKRIAAPPVGATKEPGPALPVIAERYAELLKVGAEVT